MQHRRRAPLASLALSVVAFAALTATALGWANGPNEGNGYGTHDWIVGQAVKVFDGSPPAWFDLNAALLATDDPDTQFRAVNEHVFNEKGYGRGAVDRITTFYHQALVAHQAGDDLTASIAFGWMAHYLGDILQPYHTNYAAIDLDASHLAYELLVDKQTRTADMSPAWMTPDRTPKAVADVRTRAIAAAAYSRGFFKELYTQFHADETILNTRVSEITGLLLRRASSDLADMLYSLDKGVGDAAPAATVTASVKYRYAGRNSTEPVTVTVKDASGRPLEGVRVDIAFPAPAGGTVLLRRYTTAAGTVTAYGAVGTSPFGKRRDVVVTVTTGAVTKTPTTWFMATYRLASGTAGFSSHVNDGTVRPGQTIRVASVAHDTKGRPVANLVVHWTWTFSNGRVVKTSATTNALGKAVTSMPVTTNMPKGKVHMTAHVQSGSVNRTSTTSFRRY
jgi:hypothetical protein